MKSLDKLKKKKSSYTRSKDIVYDHPFAVYLNKQDKKPTMKEVAALLGKRRSYMYELFLWQAYPSMEVAVKIEEITNGEVKAFDIIAPVKQYARCPHCGHKKALRRKPRDKLS